MGLGGASLELISHAFIEKLRLRANSRKTRPRSSSRSTLTRPYCHHSARSKPTLLSRVGPNFRIGFAMETGTELDE